MGKGKKHQEEAVAAASTTKGSKGGKGSKVAKPAMIEKVVKETGKRVAPGLSVTEELDELVAEIKADVKAIVAEFRSSGEQYVDEEFPADDTSVFTDPENKSDEFTAPDQWCRISEVVKRPVLFKEGCTPGDVIQGGLGTCYFLGALSTVSTIKGLLEQLFVAYDIKAGVYATRFFRDGQWQKVIIDDFIPCDADGSFIYATCKDENEIWVMLLEKAYAKLNGTYQSIDGGLSSEALADLTGGAVFPGTADAEKELKWEYLKKGLASGWLFNCSLDGGSEGMLFSSVCIWYKLVVFFLSLSLSLCRSLLC